MSNTDTLIVVVIAVVVLAGAVRIIGDIIQVVMNVIRWLFEPLAELISEIFYVMRKILKLITLPLEILLAKAKGGK